MDNRGSFTSTLISSSSTSYSTLPTNSDGEHKPSSSIKYPSIPTSATYTNPQMSPISAMPQQPPTPYVDLASPVTTSTISLSSISLPSHLKLTGADNYIEWKHAMFQTFALNGLSHYFDPRFPIPEQVDGYNANVTLEEYNQWRLWTASDTKARLLLYGNINGTTPLTIILGKSSAREMWITLNEHYEGRGVILKYDTIKAWVNMRYDDYTDLENFIISYKLCIERLVTLDIAPPILWRTVRFIMLLKPEFPIWYERVMSNACSGDFPPLEELMAEILDMARIQPSSSSSSSSSSKASGNSADTGEAKKKKKAENTRPRCMHCRREHPHHDPDDCFDVNNLNRERWEKIHGKKWVSFKDRIKKSRRR
jgi:hypothetical protein